MAIRARPDNLSLDHPLAEAAVPVAPLLDFSELWAHREALRQACVRLVGNNATADDVVQDTYVRALTSTVPLHGRTAPWLTTVARRRSIDELRSRRRLSLVETVPEAASAAFDDPAQQVVNQEQVDRLRAALKELTPRERQLLLRQAGHGISLSELADDEATSVASVRSVLARARHKLRMSLERGGALGTLPLPRFLTWRDRLYRWTLQAEGSLPIMTGAGLHLGRIVAAVVLAVAGLLAGSPSSSTDPLVTTSELLALAGSDRGASAGTDGAAKEGHRTDSGESRASDAAPTGPPAATPPSALPPIPEVDVPVVPDDADHPNDVNVTSIAASADGRVVLAGGIAATTGTGWVLYRSNDGGHSWERLGSQNHGDAGRNYMPLDAARIVMAPDYPRDPRVFLVTDTNLLKRSDDGGITFTTVGPARGTALISPAFSAGDERLFVSGPPPAVYGTGTGLRPLSAVPPSVEKGGIAFGPRFAATGEVLVGGTVPQLDDASTPAVFTCTASGCAVRATFPTMSGGPELLVSTATRGVVFAWRVGNSVFRSIDGGHTFSPFRVPAGLDFADFTESAGRVFLVGVNRGGGASGLYESADGGSTWTALGGSSARLKSGAQAVVALAGNRLIALPHLGRGLLCSADGGTTWAPECPTPL